MAIQFQCENCGKSLKTDESKAGKQVKCPGCSTVIRIPNPDEDADIDDNPFESPNAEEFTNRRARGEFDFAGPDRRLIGALLDTFLVAPFGLPGFILIGVAGGFNENQDDTNAGLALVGVSLIVLGLLTWAGLQIYLLATRSQSIGKYLLGMQILDYETKQPASFVKCAVLRGFVNGLISQIPCIGHTYGFVDACFVFSAEHRCLHDQLAGTCVVNLPKKG